MHLIQVGVGSEENLVIQTAKVAWIGRAHPRHDILYKVSALLGAVSHPKFLSVGIIGGSEKCFVAFLWRTGHHQVLGFVLLTLRIDVGLNAVGQQGHHVVCLCHCLACKGQHGCHE